MREQILLNICHDGLADARRNYGVNICRETAHDKDHHNCTADWPYIFCVAVRAKNLIQNWFGQYRNTSGHGRRNRHEKYRLE